MVDSSPREPLRGQAHVRIVASASLTNPTTDTRAWLSPKGAADPHTQAVEQITALYALPRIPWMDFQLVVLDFMQISHGPKILIRIRFDLKDRMDWATSRLTRRRRRKSSSPAATLP